MTAFSVIVPAVAALCVTVLRPISVSEYAGAYRKGIKRSHIVFLTGFAAAVVLLGFVFLGRQGLALPAVAAGYLIFMYRAFKSLDGMSGDISGYALTIGELCGIAVFALL